MKKGAGGKMQQGETKILNARERFAGGYNCAQSVFSAFCDELSIEEDLALRIACGFGAGMGRKEEVCGAVTGGIMVIGAVYGKGSTGEHSAMETTYAKVRAFMDRFSAEHGTAHLPQAPARL